MHLNKEILARILKMLLLCLALLAAGSVIAVLALNGFAIPCVFNKLTGLYCPGCGNTRCVLALLKLDFNKIFSLNPLFFLEVGYIGYVYVCCVLRYIKHKRFSYKTPFAPLDIFVLVIIVLWAIVRNIPLIF